MAGGTRAGGALILDPPDTEVLVHLYEAHGKRFAERLRGMFAVAIWDSRRRRLVLARDRFGIKPLYYRDEAGELAFASELRALPRAVRSIRRRSRRSSPSTRFRRRIRSSPELASCQPGISSFGKMARRVERYARPAGGHPRRGSRGSGRGAARTPAGLRPGAPDRRRPCRRAVVRRCGPRCSRRWPRRESGEAVHTFSIGFEERSFDELDDARSVASMYGTRSTQELTRGPMPRCSCQGSRKPSTSRSPTRLRFRPTSSRSWRRGTSRSRSPERAATSFSAATTPTLPTCWRSALAVSPSGQAPGGTAAEPKPPGELRLQGEALRPRGRFAPARATPRLEGDLLPRLAAELTGRRSGFDPARPSAPASRRRRAPELG